MRLASPKRDFTGYNPTGTQNRVDGIGHQRTVVRSRWAMVITFAIIVAFADSAGSWYGCEVTRTNHGISCPALYQPEETVHP